MSLRSCAVRARPPVFVNAQETANAPSTPAAVPIARAKVVAPLRPVAGLRTNRGRRSSLVDITAHSYRSATDARPWVSTSVRRRSSLR